ncbi:uncharacterized protein LOC121194919 isoform X1 [Toxotes jaculatrix]|uniref:uncharacterized protein LOC121194919 isoform X1 n=1 Tax=Toxotes jaculatrix TaxID=941984 RepID=UPI001B3B04A5|nr:uncharacterized protein LOC121194919 isoform X1 [Toxotes jaculatrix]XP_040914002.1 uncharacterized protein LOC121194919 isoform X1 [Toxotes jaculatrix]
MDKLKSEQDRLCVWLSCDPDHILQQCGNILTMNEFLEVKNHSSALEKMRLLLKIIIEKGGNTCQSFLDILRQHQAHYPELQQLFSSNTQGIMDQFEYIKILEEIMLPYAEEEMPLKWAFQEDNNPTHTRPPTPTVFADGNSVVTTREITNLKAKSLSMKIETVSVPGCSQSGNLVGQVPWANYTARGASVICADKISGTTIDNDVNFSVSMKTSQVNAVDAVDETQPSSQGPAVKMIKEHKMELIDCLRADCFFILQHVHATQIITDRQYQNLKHTSPPENTIANLIDQVIGKGQESCSLFAKVLKNPDVLETYPQLKEITSNWC